MKSAEIRDTYLSYFEGKGHLRRPSASLVPSVDDPSVLLTTAGMQPFQPFFRGIEEPPGPRLTSCQRCFRTVDIEEVDSTWMFRSYLRLRLEDGGKEEFAVSRIKKEVIPRIQEAISAH